MRKVQGMAYIGGSVIVVSALVGGCIGSPALGPAEGSSEGLPLYGEITPQEAVVVIQALQDDPGFVLLDIRTPSEVVAGHLPGAVELDFRSLEFANELERLDSDLIYLIYCRTANRSGQAFDIMQKTGFTKVYDMQGGIILWGQLGYPICEGPVGDEHVCVGEYPAAVRDG